MVNVDPLKVVEMVELRCFGERYKERLILLIRSFFWSARLPDKEQTQLPEFSKKGKTSLQVILEDRPEISPDIPRFPVVDLDAEFRARYKKK